LGELSSMAGDESLRREASICGVQLRCKDVGVRAERFCALFKSFNGLSMAEPTIFLTVSKVWISQLASGAVVLGYILKKEK
jgi:hypothetical protein